MRGLGARRAHSPSAIAGQAPPRRGLEDAARLRGCCDAQEPNLSCMGTTTWIRSCGGPERGNVPVVGGRVGVERGACTPMSRLRVQSHTFVRETGGLSIRAVSRGSSVRTANRRAFRTVLAPPRRACTIAAASKSRREARWCRRTACARKGETACVFRFERAQFGDERSNAPRPGGGKEVVHRVAMHDIHEAHETVGTDEAACRRCGVRSGLRARSGRAGV